MYMRHKEDMTNIRAKLYALIIQYLSQESLSEVKRHEDFEVIKASRNQIVKDANKVFMISHIAPVVKKAAQKEYQTMQQCPYESIITLRGGLMYL